MTSWLEFIGGAAVFGGVLSGIWKLWLDSRIEKIRVENQARLQTIESKLDTKRESYMLVYKAQFEREFCIYQELWAAMWDVSLQLGGLDIYSAFHMKEDKEWKRFADTKKEFMDALHAAIKLHSRYKPFYASEIDDNILSFLSAVDMLSTNLFVAVDHNQVLSERLMENPMYDGTRKKLDNIAVAIRSRIEQLKVVDL